MLQNVLPSPHSTEYSDLARNLVVQKAVLQLFREDSELDRTELCARARQLPGWNEATGQKLGKTFGVLSELGVLEREDPSTNVRIYRPGSAASALMGTTSVVPESQVSDLKKETEVASEVATDQPSEVASVTVNYDATFMALWGTHPKGELVPAQAKHRELGFVGLDNLNEFVELMLKRGHVIRVSIKHPSHARITYSGIRLTPEGKQYLAELQGYNQPSTVPATELEKPPRSEVAPAPPASEHLALIAALQREVAELRQSNIAAQVARITDVLRGQPTSIAQTCLIEAGRQQGLDLVPRPSV